MTLHTIGLILCEDCKASTSGICEFHAIHRPSITLEVSHHLRHVRFIKENGHYFITGNSLIGLILLLV